MQIKDRNFLNVSTKTCHASSIVFDPVSKEPVFAWFGGYREGAPDSSIYIQFKDVVKTIGTHEKVAYWNPVLFAIKSEVYLSFKVGVFCDRWQTYIVNLTDELVNFQNPSTNLDFLRRQTIPAGLNFCVKTKPLITSRNGIHYLLCGSSTETFYDWTSYVEGYSFNNGTFISESRSAPLAIEKIKCQTVIQSLSQAELSRSETQGIIQPTIWEDSNSKVHAFFRSSRGIGKIYYSYMTGDRWTPPCALTLKNPNSSIDTVYSCGKLYLVHNPSDKYRFPLVVSKLDDDFKIEDEIVICEEPIEYSLHPEYSYPFMVENDGFLHLVYTHERTKIGYVTIET